MVKLPPMEDKDFNGGKNYFGVGVYDIIIQKVSNGTTPNGSDFLEFEVEAEDGETGSTRLYVTKKAAPYARSTLAGIAVHNKTTEADKEKVRAAFKAIDDTDLMLDKKWYQNFEGMEAWLKVEEDLNAPKPNGGFYLRYNLYSYKPKEKSLAQQADELVSNSTPVDPDEVPFA